MSPYLQNIRKQYSKTNVTPVWLLIFWRLVKQTPNENYALAYSQLKKHLPAKYKMPTVEEVAAILALNKLV